MFTSAYELNRAYDSMHRVYRFALLCSLSVQMYSHINKPVDEHIISGLFFQGNGNNLNHGLSWQILPLLFVKILVNPKGLTAFCALIKTKSAHDKLQSIKNAWSKDEIWCLEMAALLTQGNSESDKYCFNTAF